MPSKCRKRSGASSANSLAMRSKGLLMPGCKQYSAWIRPKFSENLVGVRDCRKDCLGYGVTIVGTDRVLD